MATKKFIIEVEEGRTKCDNFCPLKRYNGGCADACEYVEKVIPFLRCRIYNLTTMKITEYEDGEEAARKDGFKFGVAYMLGRVEDWLRKTGRGQLIGSLNRFLKEKDNEPNKEIHN